MTSFSSDSNSLTARAARLHGIAHRLRELARSIHAAATKDQPAAVAAVAQLELSIDGELTALTELCAGCEDRPAEAPEPNSEHDEVEEASMESFPASDPPATRDHQL